MGLLKTSLHTGRICLPEGLSWGSGSDRLLFSSSGSWKGMSVGSGGALSGRLLSPGGSLRGRLSDCSFEIEMRSEKASFMCR